VAADDDGRCAAIEEALNRRNRCSDPKVIGDLTLVEGDVEVGAYQDALARDIEVIEPEDHAPKRATTSTSLLE
jgi:hypothetical protein